ncbi:uncharacterized protein LOC113207633 [Frankliniella occidentalis]|uniref:Uncharacterized protein LOC113207633 n=1 Tax=Frankliniella occidentalis TaxID=133901 RepID=A0A6J1SL57_FRAOC|nr:uncharacterized protein LOC113207633 [Frankliniella occidentalis]
MVDQPRDVAGWLRALCEEGCVTPTHPWAACSARPAGFDAARFSRGQRVALDNIFSMAYAELVSMLMMFAFEDQTAVLLATGRSDTPIKAYFRYLSTMRRVRTWYEGDIWDPESAAGRNVRAVRGMHDHVTRRLEDSGTGSSLHVRAAALLPAGPASDPGLDGGVAGAAREAFADVCPAAPSATATCAAGPAINQRSMAVTQVAFIGLFVLEPARFGAHAVTDEDLDALVYVWWILGRALGILDRYNVCGDSLPEALGEGSLRDDDGLLRLRTARARCRAIVGGWALPRLALASERWQLMASALCDGAALAAPGLSLPLSLGFLVDVLGAVARRPFSGPAVERVMSRRDRVWRVLYRVVLDHAMRAAPGRAFHNALFRLSLWVSHWAERTCWRRDSALRGEGPNLLTQ